VAEELRVRNEQMEADLNIAREVQLALMPRTYPTFPAYVGPGQRYLRFSHVYRPCRTLGGDFFSVLPVSGTRRGSSCVT